MEWPIPLRPVIVGYMVIKWLYGKCKMFNNQGKQKIAFLSYHQNYTAYVKFYTNSLIYFFFF